MRLGCFDDLHDPRVGTAGHYDQATPCLQIQPLFGNAAAQDARRPRSLADLPGFIGLDNGGARLADFSLEPSGNTLRRYTVTWLFASRKAPSPPAWSK